MTLTFSLFEISSSVKPTQTRVLIAPYRLNAKISIIKAVTPTTTSQAATGSNSQAKGL